MKHTEEVDQQVQVRQKLIVIKNIKEVVVMLKLHHQLLVDFLQNIIDLVFLV